ncbi:MAG: carbohydrate ABC transporter permease, partial [Actinomycetota bacterium]
MADSVTEVAAGKPGRGVSLGTLWRRLRREVTDPEKRTAYVMIAPASVLILVIAFFPVAYAIWLSFFSVIPNQPTEWVGIENYTSMLADPDFQSGLLNTVVFTVFSVSLEFVFGLWIAMALNRGFRGQGAGRAIALIPWAFPTAVSALMWRLMFQDGIGIVAYIASTLNIYTGPILTSGGALLVAGIIVDVWKTTPFIAILLLAGLQVIPGDVYEAARVDGA